MAGSEIYGVAPFNGVNFVTWSRRVQAVFSAKELDIYLESEPDVTKPAEVIKGNKAYALMLSLLSDNILSSLQSERTAKEIWKRLHSTYESKGAVSQILIRKQLATIKKRHDVPMRQHLDNVAKLVADLRLSGAEVSDIDFIVYIFMSLPVEFENVKVALENQPTSNLTVDFVSQRLIDAEALINSNNSKTRTDSRFVKTSADNAAFVSAQKELVCFHCKKKGHISKYCRNKLTCYNCGKVGHLKRNCKLKQQPKDNDKVASSAISFVAGNLQHCKFIVDSGATCHMSSERKWFSSFKTSTGTIQCASRSTCMQVKGVGEICGKTSTDVDITLKNVLYVPDLSGQLISVKCIESAGYSVNFKSGKVFIKNKDKYILFGYHEQNGQYICDFVPNCEVSLCVKNSDADLWHRRLGHSSNQVLKELGLPTSETFCEICAYSKQSAASVGKGPRRRETEPLKMIHTDICGKIEPPTYLGECYFMTMIDDFSRFMEVRLLKRKSDIVP